MCPKSKLAQNVNKICIHTGNVLNINELKKKPGQNPTEELLESLRIVVDDWTPSAASNGSKLEIHSIHEKNKTSSPEEKDELKISAKVFVSSGKVAALKEAIDNLFRALENVEIDSLVLSYYDSQNVEKDEQLNTLHELWPILESTVKQGKVQRIGVSDVDTDVFVSLFTNSKIKPNIVQINLSTCCIVPPQLQEFTKQNDVQLLTHSDPQEFLPDAAFNTVLQSVLQDDTMTFNVYWTARFLVHVKCRGVLASKGYLVCAQRIDPA